MGLRRIILAATVLAVVLPAIAGCGGEDSSGEESGGQYENGQQYENGPPPTASSQASGSVSTQECLEEVSGSEPADVRIREPEQTPDYEVTDESEMEPGRRFEVVTEAGSREELRAIAEELRYENRGEHDALSIDFYTEGTGEERQDAGIALVFNTREAACRAFQYPLEEQNTLISEDNGISVVSVEEGV